MGWNLQISGPFGILDPVWSTTALLKHPWAIIPRDPPAKRGVLQSESVYAGDNDFMRAGASEE